MLPNAGGEGVKLYRPEMILLEKRAQSWPLAGQIINRLPEVPVKVIEDVRPLLKDIRRKPDPVGAGKKYLHLAYDPGRSFKPFPESEQYYSCDYFTLHLSEGCDLECSYCILQSYLTNPLLTVYVNLPEMLEQLDKVLERHPERFFRIGTGQLADSLSLDPVTRFSEILVPYFADKQNAVLELKTKSHFIEQLTGLRSLGRTIVSWSMNSEKVQKQEEHKTATMEERLQAAETLCRETDFQVGFHFDPIIDTPGWEEEYEDVVQRLFSRVPAERIAWISIGCLRFMPELKTIMQERFPKSPLPRAEWIRGMDGKLRYFKPRRIEIYRRFVSIIRQFSREVTLYLSMESPEVWEEVFGGEHTRESICRMLDESVTPVKSKREDASRQAETPARHPVQTTKRKLNK